MVPVAPGGGGGAAVAVATINSAGFDRLSHPVAGPMPEPVELN